ncbi:hypothetical protein ACN267_12990 [Micromonospora sp. WMMD734]|uniref:hypothetical protein n=1 Tax=Micromonospora sp. WMMD734 TaxID=3404129 RepID=UPI003B94D13A
MLQDGIRIDPYNADLHRLAGRALIAFNKPEAATKLQHRYQQSLTQVGLDSEHSHRLSFTDTRHL